MGALGAVLISFLSPAGAQPLPTPTFTNVTVHDPSVIRAGDTFYVFGSHLASASTTDWMHWTQISTSAAAGNPLVPNPAVEFRDVLNWAQATTFWAPDHIRLPDGRYAMYYCACKGDRPLSALGLAFADSITGPYTHSAVLLRSGMSGTSEDGTPYDATYHPNVVDPAVFFDAAGKLWMVYGSYSGGIFILEMDPATGLQKPGQGYGKKLLGKYHARIEGPYILYAPQSHYYYLFLSFGGLNANDGYNIRVARSRTPDGPYVDANGTDMITVGGTPSQILAAADPLIAPHGVKLMGNYQFAHINGEPGAATQGYLSPGHNSAYYDPATGKYFLVFHTRFVGRGETHEVRVHQMFMNDQGWFVVAPHRYAGETIAKITARQVSNGPLPGSFKLINHGKAISGAVNGSSIITLGLDGSVGGSMNGVWNIEQDYGLRLSLSGQDYRGVFVRQWDDDNQVWVLGFTALSLDGTAVWGSKVAAANAVIAPALSSQPASQSVAANGTLTLTSGATGAPAPELQWLRNGVAIGGATSATLTLSAATSADTGIYTFEAANFAGSAGSTPAVVGVSSTAKVIGTGEELTPVDIHHPNGNIFDQVLLTGAAETITADAGQVTRTSYIDLDNDIVQVEFSGPGSLSLVLDNASGRAKPENYNQDIDYMKGHAGIVITGATEQTHVSVFSVGRATAVNQALFKDTVTYDGIADIAFIAISSANGRFGGVRTANTNYFASKGVTGIYAPGVAFDGPVFVGNITAFDSAKPKLVLGSATDVRVTGGDLLQDNGQPVEVSGITQLRFTAGSDSHGNSVSAKANRAVLQENGQDVTGQIVVNP